MAIKTNTLIKKHTKCLMYLEMIAKCDRYANSFKMTSQFGPINTHNKKMVAKYAAIKNRLVQAYANAFMRIINPVVEQMSDATRMDCLVNQIHNNTVVLAEAFNY